MKVGDLLKVTIIDDNHLGNGIAKIDDKVLFVPNTIKGDIVKLKVLSINKKKVNTRVIGFIEKSPEHLKVNCPFYDKCGGCSLLHISYDREKTLKKEYIKRLFGLDLNIISYDREHYRNKVTLHVLNNNIGFYKEKSNDLVSFDNCLLLDNDINKIIPIIKDFDLSNTKEIVIKKANEGLLISIKGSINANDLKVLKPNVKSIYIDNKLVYGSEYLTLTLNGITYNINHNSFFQINEKCAKSLYDYIKEEVGNCDKLLDLYCGIGSIGIYVSANVKKVTGIEINKDSVKCAKKNIKDNNIKNYEIINADASYINEDYDVVIVDPPRSGLSKDVINILNKMNMKKLIYVSCNPSTLKRDVDLLNSFYLKKTIAFNMFPSTSHCESVCVLERE